MFFFDPADEIERAVAAAPPHNRSRCPLCHKRLERGSSWGLLPECRSPLGWIRIDFDIWPLDALLFLSLDREFFKKLYKGYAAEHFVSSALPQLGYETFRLPADVGLDLVVTNQFKSASGDETNREKFPYGIQVKSRWLGRNDMVEGPNGRPELNVTFSLKQTEFDLLLAQETTGAVLITFVERAVFRCIWLDAQNLRIMKERGFFRPEFDQLFLTVVYRLKPKITRAEFVQNFNQEVSNASAASAYLERMLPVQLDRNWNAQDYMRFARTSRDGSSSVVFRSFWNVAENFGSFPWQQPIGGLD